MQAYLEHANLTFADLDAALTFFEIALPEYKVRGSGGGNGERKWIHIGTDATYLCLNDAAEAGETGKNYARPGLNHLGFVVEDVEAIAQRLLNAGYTRSYPKQVQPSRIRDYFLDHEGNEYEFVQYLTAVAAERNDYSD
ncbi:MAG: VOC family protein [Bacteroidota bacterium]